MSKFHRLLSAAAVAAVCTLSAYSRTATGDYADGVFVLNEGLFGTERATINFLDSDGAWHYRVPLTMQGSEVTLGTTGCFAIIHEGLMYVVTKKMSLLNASVHDPSITVCDASSMEVTAQINNIATDGGSVAADARAILPAGELRKAYVSSTNGIYVVSLDDWSVSGPIAGTDCASAGVYNNQAGNMVLHDGRLFVVDQERGLLVIDTTDDTLIKTVNNQPEGWSYGSVVQSLDGSLWLSVSDKNGNGTTRNTIVRVNPDTYETTDIDLSDGLYAPANSWGAWTPDCFTASPTENVLYWNGGDGPWTSGQMLFRYDIDNNTVQKVIDFTQDGNTPQPYIYGSCCRVSPKDGNIYIGVTIGAWSNNQELRVYSPDGTLVNSYPMEQNYWYPCLPVFANDGNTNGMTTTTTDGNATVTARYNADGQLIDTPQRGINILRMSDGSTRKVLVK